MRQLAPSFLLAVLCLISCSPKKISVERLGGENYRYVLDFQSRIAQEKMHILRGNYAAASVGVFFIDAAGNSLDDPKQPDRVTNMPKLFRRIRIKNNGNGILLADLVTDLTIDQEHNCSVRSIRLPKGRSITLLVARDEPYTLFWRFDGREVRTYDFNPASERILKVTELGVNPTVFY